MKSVVAQNPFASEAEVCLESRIERLCWSQQGAALLASTASGELILFDENGSACHRWTGHEGRITQIGLSCNNDFVASAGVDLVHLMLPGRYRSISSCSYKKAFFYTIV